MLPRWTPGVGNALHATQLAIAWRGLELLRVGGLLCYSTCSLNPIEDEAVVAALLGRAAGAVEFEAWPADVLRRCGAPGLRSWRVADHADADDDDDDEEVALRWHASFDAARAAGVAHAVPTMWPPPPPTPRGCASSAARGCCRTTRTPAASSSRCCANARRSAAAAAAEARLRRTASSPQLLQPLPPAEAEALAGRAGLPAAPRAAGCSARRARAATARCASRRPASPPSRRARCAS